MRKQTNITCVGLLIATVVIVFVIGVVLSPGFGGEHLVTSKLNFDREDWIEDDRPWWADSDRIRMADSAVRLHLQPGGTRDRVLDELGEPFTTVTVKDGFELWYELGPHRTDGWWLVAEFSSEGVLTGANYGSYTPPPGAPR